MFAAIATFDARAVKAYLLDLQARIVAALEAADGLPFRTDSWERPEGGGGISRLIEEGNVLERGGNGASATRVWRVWSGTTASIPVSKLPGAIATARMPWRASSLASGNVMPATPPLELP